MDSDRELPEDRLGGEGASELGALDRAIAALEGQRAILGSEVVETALAPLREKRAALLARPTAEQRKLVTVLFADVVDFTVLSQALDPEDTRSIINVYFQRWHHEIEAAGGVVEKFIGDAVMAVFGLHQAREDDPHRAIRAALGMRAGLEDLNREIAEEHNVALAMRVGIDTGEVVVSSLDERQGQEFVVVGDTVNRAARIQAAAPPGGIQISRDTHRHVRGWFSFTSVEPLVLKGIAEPVEAFLVGSEHPPGFGLDESRGVEGIETRTIGREVPLHQLRGHFLDVTEERRRRVVTVVGEPGVGKSRLLLEFDRWLADSDQPLWRFRGRAAPMYQNVANGLLREVVALALEIQEWDPPATVRAKLETGLGPVLGKGDRARERAHLIGYWLGFDLGDSPVVAGLRHDPRGLRERASTYLAEYLAALADDLPVVILLEDLHWADEGTLSWLQTAHDSLTASRVLVVGTARQSLLERHPGWGEASSFHMRLPLEPLSRRENRLLLEEILQRADRIPDSLSDLLLDATEGNPFHLEELVKWLFESGIIVKDDGTWRVREETIDRLAVPPTLRGVLQARIDALTQPEHLVLQQASVIGRVFWDGAIDSLNSGARLAAIDDTLALLSSREVVYPRPQSAFDQTKEFLFKHSVLRDVAYDSVLREHRQRYHRLVARWLEQMTERNERSDEYAALIAGHYDNSGDAVTAGRWYLRAAEQASSVHALAEATRLLDRALEVVPDDEQELRFDLILARERVFDRRGERDAQRRDLDVLEQLAKHLDDSRGVELLVRRAGWHFGQSEYDEQASAAEAAVELARRVGLAVLEAEALLWWGMGLTWNGAHSAAKDVLRRALEKARLVGQGRLEGESLRYLAIVANNESQFPLAIGLLEQARAVHAANKDVEGESSTLVQLGSVLYNLGRLREARVWLEESLPIFVASGHKYRQAVVRSNLGTILLQEGELGPARQLINEGLEGCLELDDREGVACALGALGDLYRRVGDHQEAQHTLRRSLAIALEIGFDFLASDDVLFLGLDELDSGRVTEAISLLDDSLEHARRAQSPLAETRAQVARTYGFLADGQLEQAQLAANAARAGAQHLDLGAIVVELDVLRARIAALRGGRDEALRLVETAQAQIDSDVLEGSIRPGEMMLACWRILDELGDPRAATALRAGRDFLDDFASRIDDEQLCTGFLRHVPAHVALASAGRVGPV